MDKAKTGMRGELAAARYLREHGFTILSANYRCRLGEIDIIASDRAYICFVEVKTRSPQMLGKPADAVDAVKRKKLLAAASRYLSQNPTNLQPRFDVVEVYVRDGAVLRVRHMPNAFDGEGL